MQNMKMGFMTMQVQQPCTKCNGRGKSAQKNCVHCKGKKVVKENKTLEILIEKGMKNGDTIIFEKQGEQVPDMIQGDVVFTLKQQSHHQFKRVGDNLYYNLDINLQEALLGFKRTITHLDGHHVEIVSDAISVTQPFSW